MATTNPRGIPAISATLMRPHQPTTTAPEPVDLEPAALAEPEGDDTPVDQGRGSEPRTTAARSTRTRRPAKPTAAEKTGKRGLYLTDGVWDRLQYEAIRRRTTVSAIAEDVLAKNLPRFKVEREG